MDTEQLVGTSMLRGNQKLNTNDSTFYHGQHSQTHTSDSPIVENRLLAK